MTTLILAFLFMVTIVGAMAIGLYFGRSPITGSCGGMKALGMDVECEICGGDPARCEESRSSGLDSPQTPLGKRIGR